MIRKIFYTITILLFIDVIICRNILHFGFKFFSEEETIQRYNVPYIEFTARPNINDHNQLGYKGKSIESISDSTYNILFFAGSTGYYGDTTLPQFIELELNSRNNKKFNIINCSVVSSNHNQHLHALLEQFLLIKIDMVIFYGGYNELIGPLLYDPRPGYPFNYYYKNECNKILIELIRYSAILGEIEKRHYAISGLKWFRQKYEKTYLNWHKDIEINYLKTLKKANLLVTNTQLNLNNQATQFIAIQQPYIIPKSFIATNKEVTKEIDALNYGYNISNIFLENQNKYFVDDVHLNNNGSKIVAKEIGKIILSNFTK